MRPGRTSRLRLSAGLLALGLATLGTALAGIGGEADAGPAAGRTAAAAERVDGGRGRRPAGAADSARFPHEVHAGLFPLCTGCHGGVGRGDSADFYPGPESCADCHDGRQEERVAWAGPRREPGNLVFDHAAHAAELEEAGEPPASCESCHTPAGASRMTVSGRAVADRCLGCHEHRARSHHADARCSTCHRPLAATRFGADRIASLPEPDDHDRPDFLAAAHGEAAERAEAGCRTCHTRERCTSCHVEGAERDAVAALPSAPPDMDPPRFAARYPTPLTHRSGDFTEGHGELARPGACSTCHTRQSCTTCHVDAPPRAVARLPDRRRTRAPGVTTDRRAPASHRAPGFGANHGDLASADPERCVSCHSESSCTDCHAGGTSLADTLPRDATPAADSTPRVRAAGSDSAGRRWTSWPEGETRSEPGGFHPGDFMARHSAAAYGRRMECANCHSTGAFCRECHRRTGMGSSGRVGPGFHDAQPLWLLRHGQAARQTLESCASCHRQRDCVQCHSTTGPFSVNPHGPDFAPGRFADRNRQVCLACHLSDPLGGGEGP